MTTEMIRFENDHYQLTADPTYQHNFEEMKNRVNQPMEKRIRWIRDEGKNSIESIDGAVVIERTADVQRKTQAELWEVARKQKEIMLDWVMKLGAGLYVIGLAAGAVSSEALTGGSALGEVVCGVIFIAGAILAGRDADQVEGWQRAPSQEVAKQRTLAYTKTDVTAHQAALHPAELNDFIDRSQQWQTAHL
jgi:hypothetical protein